MKTEYPGDWRATVHKQMLGRVGQLGNDTPKRQHLSVTQGAACNDSKRAQAQQRSFIRLRAFW